jgi:hypothetical protein
LKSSFTARETIRAWRCNLATWGWRTAQRDGRAPCGGGAVLRLGGAGECGRIAAEADDAGMWVRGLSGQAEPLFIADLF